MSIFNTAGLCETCAYVKRLKNDRGSVFFHCGLAATDNRFPRYPRLPVTRCEGYKKEEPKPATESGE